MLEKLKQVSFRKLEKEKYYLAWIWGTDLKIGWCVIFFKENIFYTTEGLNLLAYNSTDCLKKVYGPLPEFKE